MRLAPPLVAFEDRPPPRVAAPLPRLRRHLGEHRGVEDPEVDALPRERMDGVCGIADEGDPGRRVRRGPDRAEGKSGPRPRPFDGPEPPLEGDLKLVPERLVGEGEQVLRVLALGRPDDRAQAVRQREERERTRRAGHLPGDVAVRALRAHGAHDAELAVVASPDRDPGELADEGVCAVGPDEESRADPRRAEIDDHLAGPKREPRHPRRSDPGDSERFRGHLQRLHDHPVRDDVTEVLRPDRRRVESDLGAAPRLPDPHPSEGGRAGDPLPRSEPPEDPLRGDGEGAHPAVTFRAPLAPLHHQDLEPGPGEARGRDEAGEAPARHRHVVALSGHRDLPPPARTRPRARRRQGPHARPRLHPAASPHPS